GNKKQLENLLQDVHFIGKKRGNGFGQVSSVLVESIPEDYSLIDKEGYPSRVIPVSELGALKIDEDKKNISLHAYIPPYSNPKNRVISYVPKINLPALEPGIEDIEDEFDEDMEGEFYFD